MTTPIMIWTFRRTGGTTLTDLMQERSEHPVADQEPFNWDRGFGWVSQAWAEHRDPARLRADLDRVLADHPTIKHCMEMQSEPFNTQLFEAATAAGYRHMMLDRRDEVSRLLSLELARQTGAWGKMGSEERYARVERGELVLEAADIPELVAHLRLCHARRRQLRDTARARAIPLREVFFEDIYADPDRGRALIHDILADYGLDLPGDAALEARITVALVHRGQNSARMLGWLPNLAELRQRLAQADARQRERG